jgi:hypothetical protein
VKDPLLREFSTSGVFDEVSFRVIVLISQFKVFLLYLGHQISHMMLVEVHGKGAAEVRCLFH